MDRLHNTACDNEDILKQFCPFIKVNRKSVKIGIFQDETCDKKLKKLHIWSKLLFCLLTVTFVIVLFFSPHLFDDLPQVCPDDRGPGQPLLPLKETLHAQAQQRDCHQRYSSIAPTVGVASQNRAKGSNLCQLYLQAVWV